MIHPHPHHPITDHNLRDTVIESFRPLNDALFDFSNAGDEVSKPLVAYSSAPIIILGIFLAIGGLLALRGTQFSTYFCIQTWFILPLLFLLIILACAIAAIISTFLTVNSGEHLPPCTKILSLVQVR
jgi:hypothetical protein